MIHSEIPGNYSKYTPRVRNTPLKRLPIIHNIHGVQRLSEPGLPGHILPRQISRALASFHGTGRFPAQTYALSYRVHKWPAVARSTPQLPGQGHRGHQSWTTNANVGSGTKMLAACSKYKAPSHHLGKLKGQAA